MKVVRKMIVAVLCCAVIMGMTLSAEAATGRGISEVQRNKVVPGYPYAVTASPGVNFRSAPASGNNVICMWPQHRWLYGLREDPTPVPELNTYLWFFGYIGPGYGYLSGQQGYAARQYVDPNPG